MILKRRSVLMMTFIGLVWIWIAVSLNGRTARLERQNRARLVELENTLEREARELLARGRLAANARRRQMEEEFVQAAGGRAQAAMKNPNLTIAQAIEGVAKALAPRGTRVSVSVDRFTEFSAALEMPSGYSDAAMAELARAILSHCAEYLDRVQFLSGGMVSVELGRREIESIKDWEKTSAVEVQRLFTSPVALAAMNVSPDKEDEAIENMSPEMQRQRAAQTQYNAANATAHTQFANAVELAGKAVDMTGVRQVSDLAARSEMLRQAHAAMKAARPIMERPATEYAQILAEIGVDEVYARAAVRTVAEKSASSRQATELVFVELERLMGVEADYLDALAAHFGNWIYDAAGRKYQFTSENAHLGVVRAMDRYERRIEAFNSAMKTRNQIMETAGP